MTKAAPLPAYAVNPDPLLTEQQAADYLAVARSTLANWRSQYPDRIPFLRMGTRAVRYRKSSLDAYIQQRQVTDGQGVQP
mgnify:CR=1 FL=1